MHVIIVGAGTGGLALAHGLMQAGVEVTVYERDRAPRDSPGGYRVGISPAGSRALKECIPASLYKLFVATSARSPRYFTLFTEQFAELLRLQVTDAPVDGEKNVDRMMLRQVLLTGLDDVVSFGKNFTRYEVNTNATVTAYFEDGTQCTGDVLIGADGTGSRVRKQRLPQARHEDTGIISLGGRLPLTRDTKALLTDTMFNGMSMIMAPKGYGAIIHVLEFDWNREEGHKDSIGNGTDRPLWLGLESRIDNYVGWGLWASHEWFPPEPCKQSSTELLRIAQDMTVTWHPRMRTLIQMTDPRTVKCISVRTSVPVPPWESSNITLLGDSIHTMTPGRGAGANTALRDAALLCKILAGVARAKNALVTAIHEYEAEMLRYSSEAVIESRKQMDSNDMIHKPIIGRIQLAAMRAGARFVNSVPALKRRITQSIMRVRAAN